MAVPFFVEERGPTEVPWPILTVTGRRAPKTQGGRGERTPPRRYPRSGREQRPRASGPPPLAGRAKGGVPP